MSSLHGASKKKRAVRFATDSAQPPPYKKNRLEDDDDDDPLYPPDTAPDNNDGLPTKQQLLQAKQQRRDRRQQQQHDNTTTTSISTTTHIDTTTSLASDGIPIEPFHMESEQSDGTGYFDGDTYVFRKSNNEDEPEDAWLDGLEEDDQKPSARPPPRAASTNDDDDDVTETELYAKLLPNLQENETVLQALVRYGKDLKKKNNNNHTASQRDCFHDVTEASGSLATRFGRVEVYQMTAGHIRLQLDDAQAKHNHVAAATNIIPPHHSKTSKTTTTTTTTTTPTMVVHWEYRGSADGHIHGPYTSAQMRTWIQAGYFVGPSAVMVRRVGGEKKSNQPPKDELLADLMNDNDEEEQTSSSKKATSEWIMSDKVDYSNYI